MSIMMIIDDDELLYVYERMNDGYDLVNGIVLAFFLFLSLSYCLPSRRELIIVHH